MAMLRALSTSRSRRGGYDRLQNDTIPINDNNINPSFGHNSHHAVLKRVTSVPVRMLFGYSTKNPNPQPVKNSKPHQGKQGGMTHPLFSLFDSIKRKKKNKVVTANPEFCRYMEYVKEGGVWNDVTNSPVIYYK